MLLVTSHSSTDIQTEFCSSI
nr:unnamed protein product [Callosobruchus chinensis]